MDDFRNKNIPVWWHFQKFYNRNLKPRPHVSVLFENKGFFLRLAYRLHLSGENCYRRRIFSKTRSRFFKMLAYCFLVDLACEQALRGALAARRGREKEGELATTSLELIWISAEICIEKYIDKVEMLIGEDDISNDVITLGTCFFMVVYIRARFRFALTAQSKRSHRGIGGGIQIPET